MKGLLWLKLGSFLKRSIVLIEPSKLTQKVSVLGNAGDLFWSSRSHARQDLRGQ